MSESQPDRVLSLLAMCGIIGPVLYAIVVISLGLLRPGYNHVTQPMSELGAAGAPNAIVMNTLGFPLLGLLIIAFAFGLHRGTKAGSWSKVGLALLAIVGSGYMAMGLFPCDLGCVTTSLTGMIHGLVSRLVGSGLFLAPLAIAQSFKRDHRWERYRMYTLATGLVTLVTAILVLTPFFIVVEGWRGAFQRIFLVGVPLLWIEIVAIKLLRFSISGRIQG